MQQRLRATEPRPLAALQVARHGWSLRENALGPFAHFGNPILRSEERGVVEERGGSPHDPEVRPSADSSPS